MDIRKLSVSDCDSLLILWKEANLPFKPKGRDSKQALLTEIKANPDSFIGAFDDGKLVGAAIVTCDSRKGWMNRLAVLPSHRNRGIAATLITECEKTLRKKGFTIFCALIEEPNSASRQLFKKCGYTEHSDILYFSKRDSEDV